MQAIELNTQIQADGVISLPETYKYWFGKNAKLILLETTEPVATENTAYAIFSQLDLGEGDDTLVCSAQVKQGIKAVLERKVEP
ncbi:MAG: hypothetical protein NTV43_06720 [Methylococcales bacterium]|nr:hypothetical protein [Methylococcales bacterium]